MAQASRAWLTCAAADSGSSARRRPLKPSPHQVDLAGEAEPGKAWSRGTLRVPHGSVPARPSEQGGVVSAPAGWYTDQTYPDYQRYWDGAQWTNSWTPHTQPYGQNMAPRTIGFTEAVRRAFRQYGTFGGRATVAEYWWFYLFAVLLILPFYVLLFVAGATTAPTSGYGAQPTISPGTGLALGLVALLLLAVVLALLLPQLSVTVRRLHDTDRSAWWLLITLIPLASLVLLVFMLLPSTPGPNRYGYPVQ
jgi:uncharacterized membrane protein YhaH (DUF805 family)